MTPVEHVPVLAAAIHEYVHLDPDSVVVDATVGQGGHAKLFAAQLNEQGRLILLDVDPESLVATRVQLVGSSCFITYIRENFGNLDNVLQEQGVEKVDMIWADLGVCSAQLDAPERGMSFQADGPLDMRLDDRLEKTAADLVNGLPQDKLADLIYQFGEERKSRRIAWAIVQQRKKKPLQSTQELVEVIKRALNIRGEGSRYRIHPATRTFQALRIAVNQELDQLERLLKVAPQCLNAGGYIGVISFHSLEDRLVKINFRENKTAGKYMVLTKKPIVADVAERKRNPRSRSAKLRLARRIEEID
jgi:16S rRNA (cytosine1402-N4)-methyltransferase